MKLTKGLIKADIIAARQAIEYFEQKNNKDIKNIAAYHLQQAAEKLIKLQIYKSLQCTDNKRMYTHDLSKLIDYAVESLLATACDIHYKLHILTMSSRSNSSSMMFVTLIPSGVLCAE